MGTTVKRKPFAALRNTLRLHRAQKGEKGVTQFDVCHALYMHRDRYWRIENGHTAPTDEEKAAFAAYFGVKESALFPRTRRAVKDGNGEAASVA